MSNNLDTLREHLFKTLEALSDKDNPMDIQRAKAISDVAQVIINSATVEVKHMQATGAAGSAFLDSDSGKEKTIPGVTVHRLRG